MPKDSEITEKKVSRRTILGLVIFLFKELLRQKKWFLLPLWVLLAAIALLLFISSSSFILPAIYIIGF
jgi:hypothetical protein